MYKELDACSENGFYYSVKKLLTYNRPWNFVIASRSIGKSTAIKIFFILDFLENGHKFIYMRRTRDEMMLTAPDYFDDGVQIINQHTKYQIEDFNYKGGEYYIKLKGSDPVQCGRTAALSLEQKLKSSNFSEYWNLVYDEFIASTPTGYLGSMKTPEREFNALLSLYQTIDRGIGRPYRNETRFFFMGNTLTVYNPVFIKLGIPKYIHENSKVIAPKNALWIVERLDKVKATETIEESFGYRLSDEYNRKYAYENTGIDTNAFVKRPGVAVYKYTLKIKGIEYGIYYGKDKKIYIDRPRPGFFVLSLDNLSFNNDDLRLIVKWQQSELTKGLSDAYKNGKLYFGNGSIKNAFLIYLDMTQ